MTTTAIKSEPPTTASNDRGQVALLFSVSFLLIASQTAVKAARDALFLTHFGLTQLSLVMIVMAVCAGLGIALFERISKNAARDRVIMGLYGFVAVTLWAASLLVHTRQVSWLCWVLYIWSGIFSLMTLAEFWLLANALFDAQEGKRRFGLLGAGAILGGLVGGFASAGLARYGTQYLLQAAALAMVLAAVLATIAWHRRSVECRTGKLATIERCDDENPNEPITLRMLWNDRYVRLIGSLTLCLVICLTLAEWQYKAIAKLHYGTHTAEMASFFGLVAGVVNSVIFVVQTVFTSKLLHRYGVPATLRVLPSAAGLGAVVLIGTLVLPIPILLPATASVMLTDGLRFSLDKAAVEMIYLPIKRRMRERARRVIDIFVDRFGGAVAGLLWLAMYALFGVDESHRIAWPSFVVLAIVAVWGLQARSMRRAYLQAYRGWLVGDAPPQPAATQEVRDWATAQLRALPKEPRLRTAALRVLNQKQIHVAPFRLDHRLMDPHLVDEVRYAKQLHRALVTMKRTKMQPLRLIAELESSLMRSLERVGRLLALVYPPRDIYYTHRALRDKSRRIRAAAIELIDALVDSDVKHDLIAILEDMALEQHTVRQGDARVVLSELQRAPDSELRKLAARVAAECHDPEVTSEVAALARQH